MPDKTPDRPRIFLNNVHLKGSKSIEDLSIDFQKGLNILIGKNGSGKSNFMEFLYEVMLSKRNDKFLFNYARIELVSNDSHSFVIELEKEFHSKIIKKDFDDGNELLRRFFIDGEILFDSANDEYSKKTVEFKSKKIKYIGNLRGLFAKLGYSYLYPLYIKFTLPDNLEGINIPGSIRASLGNPFINLSYPDTLGFMDDIFFNMDSFAGDAIDTIRQITKSELLEDLVIQEEIINNLKLYTTVEDARFNDNINLYNDEKSVVIENIKLEFKINGSWLPWSQLSDGTKRLFYIISEVTNSTGLILIEEPELGIHPHQFNLLMNFLKEQSEDKQIIISTHAPKALDHLSPDELNNILITSYSSKKGTQMRHLTLKEVKKAKRYAKEVGFFSDYWLLSDLEE